MKHGLEKVPSVSIVAVHGLNGVIGAGSNMGMFRCLPSLLFALISNNGQTTGRAQGAHIFRVGYNAVPRVAGSIFPNCFH